MEIHDQCRCGANLAVAGSWTDCHSAHDRWLRAHKVCREQPAQHSEPGRIPEGYSEKLWAVHSALSDALGDSDVDWIESDEELRTEEPIQWAAKEIANMLAPAPDADERE